MASRPGVVRSSSHPHGSRGPDGGRSPRPPRSAEEGDGAGSAAQIDDSAAGRSAASSWTQPVTSDSYECGTSASRSRSPAMAARSVSAVCWCWWPSVGPTLPTACAIGIASCVLHRTPISMSWSASGSGARGRPGAGHWTTCPPAATDRPGRDRPGGGVLPDDPPRVRAHDGPAEILCVLDHDGQRTHLRHAP